MAGYTVIPLTVNDLDWLKPHGLVAPALAADSRYPSIAELQYAVSIVENFEVEVGPTHDQESWPIVMKRPDNEQLTTMIRVTPLTDPAAPHGYWFEDAWPPLAVALVQHLAAVTGPTGLVALEDGSAVLVEATSDVGEILRTWKHTAT